MQNEIDVSGEPYRAIPQRSAKASVVNMLIVSKLCHSYDGLRRTADEVTFSVRQGSVFALIGPNGAGKTSILRMLAGLMEPTAGQVTIDGTEMSANSTLARGKIGYLPDDFALYEHLTANAQLLFFARLYGLADSVAVERIDQLLQEFDLLAHRDRQVGEFSRGMKQRLGLVKTLLHAPKLLLLDEPASALDPDSRAKLKASLARLKDRGMSIVISSHILPDLAGLADAVGILERGKLLYTGPIDQAMTVQTQQQIYIFRVLVPEQAEHVFANFGSDLCEVQKESPQCYRVLLDGGPERIAALIEKLSLAGARVYSASPAESAIETVYRMTSTNKVA